MHFLIGGTRPSDVGPGPSSLAGLRLRTGESVERILPLAVGLVVQVVDLTGAEPSSHIYWVRDGVSTLVTRATGGVALSSAGDRVYALDYGPPGSTGTRSLSTLLEVTLSGTVLARHRVPAGYTIAGDTPAGLLVALYSPTSGLGHLQLVNRRTLRVLRALGPVEQVIAMDSRRAAWQVTTCEETCDLAVEDFATGHRDVVTAAMGYSLANGSFSPDGRRLALAYFGRHPQQPGGAAPGFVDVQTIETRVRQRVPGVATGIKQAADLAWTPDGASLAVSVGLTTTNSRRIGLWPLTGGALKVLPGRYSDRSSSSALAVLQRSFSE